MTHYPDPLGGSLGRGITAVPTNAAVLVTLADGRTACFQAAGFRAADGLLALYELDGAGAEQLTVALAPGAWLSASRLDPEVRSASPFGLLSVRPPAEPPVVRKRIETDESGRIVAITEEPS